MWVKLHEKFRKNKNLKRVWILIALKMYFRVHSTWKKAKLETVPMNNDFFKKLGFQSTDDREKKDNRTKDCSVEKYAQVWMCGWGQIKDLRHLVLLLKWNNLVLFQLANQLWALIALVRRSTICMTFLNYTSLILITTIFLLLNKVDSGPRTNHLPWILIWTNQMQGNVFTIALVCRDTVRLGFHTYEGSPFFRLFSYRDPR